MAEHTILLPQTLTAPFLCVLESSLPRAKSRTQRPSPWCQLPASVFPAAPGSGSYICPEADGAALQGSGASSGGPRAPHLKRSSGLPPPARGRSFAAACLSPSVCPLLPDPLPVALGIGLWQGPKERKKCPGPGTDPPRVPCSVGLQQATLEIVGLERTLSSGFWWRSRGTLISQNPKPRELTISAFWGAGLERESGESWDWAWWCQGEGFPNRRIPSYWMRSKVILSAPLPPG